MVNNCITWSHFFLMEKKKKYFIKLMNKIANIRNYTMVYPNRNMVFNAFLLTPLLNIKVVIVGQDPYCRSGQAHGLSFSVPKGCEIPPSLKNIFQELNNNFLVFRKNINGCLTSWSKQGVFLLNSVLTVSSGLPGSHRGFGWEIFTNRVIKLISNVCSGVIFLLWGSFAYQKCLFIDQRKHFILKSSHPSPLSCYLGFFGCRHFLKTNNLLNYQKKKPIDWFQGI